METTDLLQPLMVLASWTFIIMLWMFFTRIPAMKKLRIDPQKGQDTSKLKQLLPDEVVRVSNNYNHLFEQPTLFYAVALGIALLGHVDLFYVVAAWVFVAFRVAHSLVQVTIDYVMLRFILFMGSWAALGVMILRETWMLF